MFSHLYHCTPYSLPYTLPFSHDSQSLVLKFWFINVKGLPDGYSFAGCCFIDIYANLSYRNAKNYNTLFKEFTRKLSSKEKPAKIIIVSIMRKLLHIVFGVVKSKTQFNPNFVLHG